MDRSLVTVFGGTGFLGRRVVRRLRDHGFAVRVAARRPERSASLFGLVDPHLQAVAADVHEGPTVAAALAGAWGAVNAVSLYVERGGATFESVHVGGGRRVAAEAKLAGVDRLAHVSGVGSDPGSPSLYVRKRGEGEHAVRDALPGALIVRSTVMIGPDDVFLSALLGLVRRLPLIPIFGRGETRLQPVSVDDVAEAIVRALQRDEFSGKTFELAGPRVYSYETLLRAVAAEVGRSPLLVPTPFWAWRGLGRLCERLPHPPITLNQVELMQIDNVASRGTPGLAELGVAPQALEAVLRRMLSQNSSREADEGGC
jgi:NADH dehydrogenase